MLRVTVVPRGMGRYGGRSVCRPPERMTPELTEERIAEALARVEKAASGSDNARCFALPDPSVESEWARIAPAPAPDPLRYQSDPRFKAR